MTAAQKTDDESYLRSRDPWRYTSNPVDAIRKQKILDSLQFGRGPRSHRHFFRALDIGAGEGWITKDLPASSLFGMESSDAAARRFPPNVARVFEPVGKYDLILATGVMYETYHYREFLRIIREHASYIVALCNIEGWEVPAVVELGVPRYVERFPYHEHTEVIRVYDFAAQHRA